MTELPCGSGWVCFDTTGLLHFNRAGALQTLGTWFPRAFAPNVVIEEEIRKQIANHPENKHIVEAPWLESVAITEPGDLHMVKDIHERYGREPGKDRGEAEVIVACNRHGWTGIIDDTTGEKAAADFGIAHCTLLTMILAACAHDILGEGEAWRLHCAIEESRGGSGYSALSAQGVHRQPFRACVGAFKRAIQQTGTRWPHTLALPGLNDLVKYTRERN